MNRPPKAPSRPGIAELFEREQAGMLRLAVLLVDSRALAEDIVAEAFIVVDQRWGQIDNPAGYLRSCVVNGCRMAMRRRRIERRANRRSQALPSGEEPESLVDLHRALGRLDSRQRTVIVLRYLEGVPDDEIAELIECQQSTVRSIASRALRRLRKDLS